MNLTTRLVFLFYFFFTRGSLSRAQPSNDECENAVIIPATPTFPYTDTVLDLQNATEGVNDPLISCTIVPPDNSTLTPSTMAPSVTMAPFSFVQASIWYSWTPNISGSFDFIAVGGWEYGTFAPAMAVYQSASCEEDAFQEIGCGYGYASSFDIQSDTTYFVYLVYEIYNGEPVVANMTLTIQPTPPPPPNDECVNATIIPSDPVFPYTTAVVDLVQATENPLDPFLTCNYAGGFDDDNSTLSPSTISPSFVKSDGKTVWYSWTPAVSDSYDFSITGSKDYFGYELYATLGIYEGDSCEDVEEIQCQTVSNGRLRLVELVGGTTYRIKVGVFTEHGSLLLTVQPTPPPPPNDECVNATVLPEDPTFPYTTAVVDLAQATENPLDPFLTCNYAGGFDDDNSTLSPSTISPSFVKSDGKTVWYSWTPAVSDMYDFSPNGSLDDLGYELYATIGIYEGDSCEALEEMQCQTGGARLHHVELVAGTTYRIKVGVFAEEGSVLLTVQPTPPPPPNDECVNAIPVTSGTVITGDTTNAFLDNEREQACGGYDEASGVWYKYDNANGDVFSIIASTCDEGTTFDTKISMFKGDDCGTLQCIGSVDDVYGKECVLSSILAILADEATTYWILVHGFATSTGNFTLTVDITSDFFVLVDGETNNVTHVLGDIVDYSASYMLSPMINIQAIFSDDPPVESVRMTFDNPPRSFCKGTPPYSVFGDSNGNFFGKAIPIGLHSVNATAYAESDCQGAEVAMLSQSFEVVGCSLYFQYYDASNSSSYLESEDIALSGWPCDVNIEAVVYCGFTVGGVRMEFRDTSTNTLILTRTEMVPPYFLFGVDTDGDIATGSIPPGDYSITAWVDGIQHSPYNFSVVGSCI